MSAVEIAPNRIDLSQLTAGWMPDLVESRIQGDGTPDVMNMLISSGGEVELRKGFARITSGDITSLVSGHWIRNVNYYETILSYNRKRYLVCVLSNGQDAANNVQIWVYDLVAGTFTRKDTPGVTWNKPNFEHFGLVIEGVFYGGSLGDKIYSWDPTNGWDSDATLPTADTWVNNISPGAGEKAKDYAFKKSDVLLKGSKYYKPDKDIRFTEWETDEHYNKGEKVSRKAAIGGYTYWRSYQCTRSHRSGTDADQPGTGANTNTYWKVVRLENILDTDSDITKDWSENPIARKSETAAYHGNRLFVRNGDSDNWARVAYSAPAAPEKNADIADLLFDPTDWSPTKDNDGQSGGWFDIPFSGKGDAIRAMLSFGNYLIIAGRWQSYVLAGLNDSSWTLRKLGNWGATSQQAICEMDGFVYMLGRHGTLTVTDGTQIQPVPGMDNIQLWMKERLDDVLTDTNNWFPTLVPHLGKLFISLPRHSNGALGETLVYDTKTGSFWLLDLPILDMTTGEYAGTENLWFSTAITGATGEVPTLFLYKDDAGNEVYTDDDWQAVSGTPSTDAIPWHWRSAWFQFGMSRNERRVRRVWALVAGDTTNTVTFKVFKNFVTTALTSVSRTLQSTGTRESEFIEGKVGQSGHSTYATAIQLSGSATDRTAITGLGIDTEPLRVRFKRD